MCDIQDKVKNAVLDVLGELTDKALMFSAFDVTKILRKRNIMVVHQDVKKIVHEHFVDLGFPGDYSRELFSLGNGKNTWVYYPDHSDVCDYDETALPVALDGAKSTNINVDLSDVPATQTLAGTSGPPITNFTVTIQKKKLPGVYSTDKRGRLCIPVELTRKMGLKAGDKTHFYDNSSDYSSTWVYIVNENLFNTFDGLNIGNHKVYKVDKYGNIRISHSALVKSKLTSNNLWLEQKFLPAHLCIKNA